MKIYTCKSPNGTPRSWCYISEPHSDHEPLTVYQAVEDLKTALRSFCKAILGKIQ